MKLLSVKNIVKRLLERVPQTRDDDNLLMAEVWQEELGGNWDHFVSKFTNHLLSSPESCIRCRRKLQECNPSLRGANYLKRHKEQEVVKEELKSDGWGLVEIGKDHIEWGDKKSTRCGFDPREELKGLDTNQQSLDL